MKVMQTMIRNQRHLRAWHRRLGVVTALFLILLGITGLILGFRAYIRPYRPLLSAAQQAEPDLPLSEFVESLEPGLQAPISRIEVHSGKKPWKVVVGGDEPAWLYYTPSGTLFHRDVESPNSWLRFVFKLHTGAVAGPVGEAVVALIGLLCAMLSLLGLFIWPAWIRRIKSKGRGAKAKL